MMESRDKATLIILAALALIIKLGYLFFAFEEPNSAAYLSIDALYHYKWASLIASGEFLTNAPYFRAPLYPFVLALLLKISGDNLIFVRLIQLLLGCLTLYFAFRIASRLAGKTTGIWTVVLLLLYPLTTYYEGELLLDSIFSLLALISLFYFVCLNNDRERPLAAGLFFALAALTRPTILIFVPVVFIYYFRHWSIADKRRDGLMALIKFLIMVILIITPVTVINYVTSNQFILISYQGGINFYIGNNPEADGLSSSLPGKGEDWNLNDADYLASSQSGKKLVYGDQSSFWYKKGLAFITGYPGDFIKLTARKLYFVFAGHELSNNRPLDEAVFANPWLRYLPVRFSWLVALATLPLFLAHQNRKSLYSLYILTLLYGSAVAMFFVSSRFRQPIVLPVAMAAAWGLTSLWKSLQTRDINFRLFLSVTVAVAVFIGASSMIYPVSLENPQQSLFLRGNQSLRQGDYRTAIARFDSLAQEYPDYENGHLNLGITYLKLGQVDRAAEYFRLEREHHPNSAEAANNLGVIFLLRHQNDSARYYCRRALQTKPYYTEAAINFLRTARGETDQAVLDSIESFRGNIRYAVGDQVPYIFEEGLYFSERKRYREAIDNHLRLIENLNRRQPSVSFDFTYNESIDSDEKYRKLACYQLGYLYGLTGQMESSIDFSSRAIELDPNLKEAYINLISGYRSVGRNDKADSVAAVYLSHWPQP